MDKKQFTEEQLKLIGDIKKLNLVQCLKLLRECAIIQSQEYQSKLKSLEDMRKDVSNPQ